MALPIKIMLCNCHSDYQDKTYGKGKRVFNYAAKKGTYRCTVCKTERS